MRKMSKQSLFRNICTTMLLILTALLITGCVVPQPPGHGTRFLLRSPTSSRFYYLYLPAGYTPARPWPMVVTLHGMKPFDSPEAQSREWQQMADRYGMVILAPELYNSDLFMQYPLRNISKGVIEDEKQVVTIIKYIRSRCHIDSKRIFATSWSSGGYLLHYIVNHNPDLFAALCARGSCFSEEILNPANARKMAKRGFPVMIYWGQNDIVWIRSDSERAVRWYRKFGFKVKQEVVPGKGHERLPEEAAAFFAKHTGIISRVQQVEIQASGIIGVSPFTINVTATLPGVPKARYRDYKFVWLVDKKKQTEGKGEHLLFVTVYEPGEHTITVKVTSPDGYKMENSIKIRVLPSLPNIPKP